MPIVLQPEPQQTKHVEALEICISLKILRADLMFGLENSPSFRPSFSMPDNPSYWPHLLSNIADEELQDRMNGK